MKCNPLVSVVITTYKRETELLCKAIESVQQQSYKDIEIIVVDDNGVGSQYQVENQKIIQNQQNITYIANEKNSGAQFSRNVGIINSSGKYIAFLDDDDFWLPSKIEKQMSQFRIDPNLGMVFCDGFVFEDDDENAKKKYQAFPRFGEQITYEMLLERDYIGTTTQVMIRSEAFARSGIFDIDLPARQDYEMWIRIAKYNKIIGISDTLFMHRIHKGEQISKSSKRRGAGYQIIYKKNKDAYRKNRVAKCRILMKIGKCYWESNERCRGLLFALRGMLSDPVCFLSTVRRRAETNG